MPSANHYKFRPPRCLVLTEVERWTGRRWVPDDGEPGYAFSARQRHNGYPYAFFPNCECDGNCPVRIASSRTCERFGCSNGRTVYRPRTKR